jgi:hypothetical protein
LLPPRPDDPDRRRLEDRLPPLPLFDERVRERDEEFDIPRPRSLAID